MSPSARGLLPGLLLALVASLGVLGANGNWLLPALDETGVRALSAAPQLASGRPATLPIAAWNAPEPRSGLEGEGKLLPLLMAAGVRQGAKPFAAGLWVVAGAAGVAVLAAAWVVGGVAGPPAAVTVGLVLLASPLTAEAGTTLGGDLLVAALVLLLLGTMTYRPTWSLAQGALAALAWLAGPVGLGAVAAVALWPMARRTRGWRRMRDLLLGLLPAAALVFEGVRRGIPMPPAWTPRQGSWGGAAAGLAHWAAPGVGGGAGLVLGGAVLVAVLALCVGEAATAPRPDGPVHWSDPAAPDALALAFRPAVALLVSATALGALGALGPGRAGHGLGRPWLPAAFLVGTAGAAAAWRWHRGREAGRRRAAGWAPVVALTLWICAGAVGGARALTSIRADGRGLTARVWVASPVIRWLDNRAPSGATIYASEPALVFVQTGKGARGIPLVGETGAGLPDGFLSTFRARPGPVVLTGVDATDAREDAWARALALREVVRSGEGRVLVPGA